ncbi:MAG: hypothetical protein ABS38_12755 [Acidovorax sp. SCN 68-22]|nr:MAG: hypothetical protein ABS38_12755 [Acidovorax sp. SCN 68-22]
MPEWLSLHRLLVAEVPADRPVAWCNGAMVERHRFVAAVAAWQEVFAAAPGSRFGLYLEDSLNFAAALFGAWHAGKQVYLPGDRQPVTLKRLRETVDALAGDLPDGLSTAAAGREVATSFTALDPATTQLHVFTSGSSGEQVAIHKRLDQLDAEVRALQAAFGAAIDADGPAAVAATVSHQHIYGLLFQVLWPLAAGRPFVSRRLEYPEELSALPGDHACVLVSSPAHLGRLSPAYDWSGLRRSLRRVFSSGGPLPAEAAQQSLTLVGHSPTEVYGSSETGGIAWRQRAVHGERWQALPGVEWRLDDGLLAVRSDRLPDLEWWTTTDRVRTTEDGAFELLGRADRIVKVEGKRVSLSAIESALLVGGDVIAARALVLPAALGGRLGVVTVPGVAGRVVLQAHGRRAFNERLRATLLQTLERVALPRRWRHVAALPVDTQGKCTEAALTALFHPVMPEARWLEREATRARLELDIDPVLRVFDGHFPDTPILPGVAQLDWAVAFGRECFALPVHFLRIDALKFQRPVLPGARVELVLECHPGSGVLGFRYNSTDGIHSGGRIVFGNVDA